MMGAAMLTRREGMQAAALTALSYARVLGANERMQLGLIGAGERGRYVTSIFQKTDQIDLRAVCDVFGERAQQAVADAPGARPFADHRRLLDTKDLDAVLIAARRPRTSSAKPNEQALDVVKWRRVAVPVIWAARARRAPGSF